MNSRKNFVPRGTRHIWTWHLIANSRISLLSIWRSLTRMDVFFYTLELLRRARRKLTNTTLDVEQPRQRGGSQTLLFSAWVWSLGYNTLCRKVAYNSMFMRITLIKKKECKRQRWRNFLDHSTRIGWVIRLHEGLAKQNSELHLEQY